MLSQCLALGSILVQYLTESSLPPELKGYLLDHETILVPDRYSLVELLTDVPFLIQILLGLLAAVGLCSFRTWGRVVFLIYFLTILILTLITGPYVNTGWTVFVSNMSLAAEGMILALIYFSPLREEFEQAPEIEN